MGAREVARNKPTVGEEPSRSICTRPRWMPQLLQPESVHVQERFGLPFECRTAGVLSVHLHVCREPRE
jgi:hypothetical protein